jgi:hypothetical protein
LRDASGNIIASRKPGDSPSKQQVAEPERVVRQKDTYKEELKRQIEENKARKDKEKAARRNEDMQEESRILSDLNNINKRE